MADEDNLSRDEAVRGPKSSAGAGHPHPEKPEAFDHEETASDDDESGNAAHVVDNAADDPEVTSMDVHDSAHDGDDRPAD